MFQSLFHGLRCVKPSRYADCFYTHLLQNESLSGAEFKPGTVIGCHPSNKSICDISSRFNILWLTVCGIYQGGSDLEQQSGRPHKITERVQHMLRDRVKVTVSCKTPLLQTSKLHAKKASNYLPNNA